MTPDELWGRAKPFIEAALEHANGTHTVEDVAAQIIEGKLLLWVGERCACVSEILLFPRKRFMNVFLAGGDLKEMKAMRAGVEAYARGHLCDGVMFAGRLTPEAKRQPWTRAAGGYGPTHVSFLREFGP